MIPFAQGMGFAIPSETIKRIMDQITRHGRVVRPWLGISGTDVNKFVARRYNLAVDHGVLLAEVLGEGPARDAGLRVGDIVVKMGESKVDGMKGLVGSLSRLAIGDEVSVEFVRNGTTYETKLRLRETPEKVVVRRR
jgi:serine protease Do